MRPEVTFAYLIGALLPLLETMRRGFGMWLVDASTMFEDYLAGGLLLFAAVLASRNHARASLALTVAWAYAAGMMGPSFWHQLEETLRGTADEPMNGVIVGFKAFLWSTCALGLVLSLRRELRRA